MEISNKHSRGANPVKEKVFSLFETVTTIPNLNNCMNGTIPLDVHQISCASEANGAEDQTPPGRGPFTGQNLQRTRKRKWSVDMDQKAIQCYE